MPVSLVLGASGQIGRFLIPRLLDRGHDVLALSRVPRASTHGALRWIGGDLYAGMPSLPALDAIFSLGPLDGFSQWLAQARIDGRPRIVAFGSMSAISKRDSGDPQERALVATLLASERRVIDAAGARGLGWTLFRPTLIYGAGIDRSLTQLAQLGMRLRVFPRIPAASGLRQPVHAADLAEACLCAHERLSTSNRTYALGGGERLAFSEMLERVRCSLQPRPLGIPLGHSSMHAALAIARLHPRWRGVHAAALDRLRTDLVADDADARTELGWKPRGFHPEASAWRAQPMPQ